jgi:hypothetical protein
MLGQGEPDHSAGGDVDHGGQIQPAFPGREVGDVATPAGVDRGSIDAEVATHQVGPDGGRRIGDRGLLPPARSATTQAGGAHQPGHPLSPLPVAATAKLGMDAWCAVAALGCLVGLADVLGELLVGALTRRGVLARWA